MSRRFTKEYCRAHFCSEGQHFAGQVISTAFARCRVGGWLSHYLTELDFNQIPAMERLARQAGVPIDLGYGLFTASQDAKADLRFARLIRAEFHATGRRKR